VGEGMIIIDWGSTNLRAKLVVNGRVEEQRATGMGIKNVRQNKFEAALVELCGDWRGRYPDFDILMSGMVGSREGWVETPYCRTPAGVGDLAAAVVGLETVTMGDAYIVPGLRHDFPDGSTDVMRGEETEVFGVLAKRAAGALAVCAPGTHSKWVNCQEGRIIDFRTWFTGEAFEKLTQDSLISGGGTGGSEQIDDDAFVRGLVLSGGSGGLLHHLFLGRTEMLTGRVAAEHLPGLVSGLLLGHEIREARQFAKGPIQLIGNNQAAGVYGRAFDWFGLSYTRWDEDVHLAGMLALQRNL
jgi:2-dehydro-3-deoxygalactonokinase